MLYNYFVIAFRNILKYKVFSFINVLGLTIGITCCILLALFIHYEFSYERHFKDYQNIYRVTSTIAVDQWTQHNSLYSPSHGSNLSTGVSRNSKCHPRGHSPRRSTSLPSVRGQGFL